MPPLVRALLGPWEWRPGVLLVLLPLLALYLVGWVRLRRRGAVRLASRWRIAAYLSGMIFLAVSLMSPVDQLGGQLFFMHMIQHKIVVMVAAPLIWLGNPFPIGLWGFPAAGRRAVGAMLREDSPLRGMLTTLSQPFVAWIAFVFIYVGWHDPGLYNLALENPQVHNLQHITFFVSAMLFWWHVTGAAPRLHKRLSPWVAIAMLVAAIPFNAITGFAIANNDTPIYTYYESVPRIWGISVMDDQALGGVIMWIPGSEMLFQAAFLILALMFIRDKKANRKPVPSGATLIEDGALIAPGLEHRARANQWRAISAEREAARLHASQGASH